MIYKNFRINIIIRLLLLIVTIFGLVSFFGKKDFFVTTLLMGILIIIQTISLITHIEKINRIVEGFLDSVKFSDFGQSINTEGLGASFDNLKHSFNRVIDDFKEIRNEKEIHYFYLQNIISNIEIGILAFQKNGKVEVANSAVKEMFNIEKIENVVDIDKNTAKFSQTFLNIKAGENQLIKINKGAEILQLSVYASEFIINNKTIILTSIKNIQLELEEQELESWQKLIRVLTHEIMNSIAPIASISSTVNLMVKELASDMQIDKNDEKHENIQDIINAIETIHKRSNGLIHFVEQYRNLTKIPKPNFKTYKIKTQFINLQKLLEPELNEKNVKLEMSVVPEQLQITADEQLIEQVLINMMKNSIQALGGTENKTLRLIANINQNGRHQVQVIDNGQGIIDEVGDKIFIPFFTTKSDGSGIGLSLSKQIMRLHSGSIKVKSEPNIETCFTLTF